ncbi:unnamed protein product, partial [Rotaria magnacalcarata]
QGQDTIQRITNQYQPATSSGFRKFDDLFRVNTENIIFFSLIYFTLNSDSPPKCFTVGDTEKTKRTPQFKDRNPLRSSTVAQTSDIVQNQSNTSVLPSLRKGLQPNKASVIHSSTKAKTESSKADD